MIQRKLKREVFKMTIKKIALRRAPVASTTPTAATASAAAPVAAPTVPAAAPTAATAPTPARKRQWQWLPLAVILAGIIIATAIIISPPPVVQVETPAPPMEAPVVAEVPPPPVEEPVAPAAQAPPAAPPVVVRVQVTQPAPVVPAPVVPAPVVPAPVVPAPVVPAPVVPAPVVPAPVVPAPVVPAPVALPTASISAVREETRGGEHWLLVETTFSGSLREVQEWTLRVGGVDLPWSSPGGTFITRLPRPSGATVLQPFLRLTNGRIVEGDRTTWTPSH